MLSSEMVQSLAPASDPDRSVGETQMLVAELEGRDRARLISSKVARIDYFLRPGDVLIFNDAATLPASIRLLTRQGREVEARLARRVESRFGAVKSQEFEVILFGEGDWHTRTEDRALPPVLKVGDTLSWIGDEGGDRVLVRVIGVSTREARRVILQFDGTERDWWARIYQYGTLVQYSHLRSCLELWSVQNVYSTRPWAFEMPSAGRSFTWELLFKLRRKGVRLETLTHAAGLSSTGDLSLDREFPLRERFEIPARTVATVEEARRSGGRVIAVGTSVVRALEGSFARLGRLEAGVGETDLILDAKSPLNIIDGVLSGVHEEQESHYGLLTAFASSQILSRVLEDARRGGLLTHEFGDTVLLIPRSNLLKSV